MNTYSLLTELVQVDGRILIDVVGYNKHHEAQRNPENGVENPIKRKTRILPTDKDPETEKFVLHITGPNNASLTGGAKPKTTKHISIEEQEKNKKGILGLGDEMMYMCPFLEGFALKNKEWRKCSKYLKGIHSADGYSQLLCRGY